MDVPISTHYERPSAFSDIQINKFGLIRVVVGVGGSTVRGFLKTSARLLKLPGKLASPKQESPHR